MDVPFIQHFIFSYFDNEKSFSSTPFLFLFNFVTIYSKTSFIDLPIGFFFNCKVFYLSTYFSRNLHKFLKIRNFLMCFTLYIVIDSRPLLCCLFQTKGVDDFIYSFVYIWFVIPEYANVKQIFNWLNKTYWNTEPRMIVCKSGF